MKEYVLRPAVQADYNFIWQLVVTTMREYVAAIWGWNEDWQMGRFRGNFDIAKWQIVEVEGQDAGAVATSRETAGSENIHLDNIYLLPLYQRRGIGGEIVQDLVKEASVTHKSLVLNVLKSNPNAKRLYERLGMVVASENEERWFLSTAPQVSKPGVTLL